MGINFFKKLIAEYRWQILIFLLIFLLSFVTGIFTASGYSSDLKPDRLINKYLFDMLKKDSSTLSFILIMSIYFVLFSVLLAISTKSKLLIAISSIIFSLFSYIAGFDIVILFVCLGLAGIVLTVISFGIFGLIFFLNLCLIMSLVIVMCRGKKVGFGTTKDIFKVLIFLVIMGVCCIAIGSIIFSIIHIFVIVE